MSDTDNRTRNNSRFSLDAWAVLIALLAATLIRFGIIPRVPW